MCDNIIVYAHQVKLQRSLLVAHIKQQLAREKETSSSEDNIESGFLETEAQSPEGTMY